MTSSSYDENDLSVSVSELSVGNTVSPNVSVSRLLKFGVDRILSDDIVPHPISSKNQPLTGVSPTGPVGSNHQIYQPQIHLYNKGNIIGFKFLYTHSLKLIVIRFLCKIPIQCI